MIMTQVYLIESKEGLYKIGYSKNVEQRFKQLKTANPNIKVIKTFSTLYASKIESLLHGYYSNKNIDGEWFELNLEDINSFEDNCKLFEKNYKILKENNNPFI